jgi:hypothetical protein
MQSALAAKGATSTIPIVFETGVDSVRAGLVVNLNRPGGNITGAASLNTELGPKRLELLHQVAPAATIIAMLQGPANFEDRSKDMQAAAHTLGVQLLILRTSTEHDITMAFATLAELRAGALMIGGGAFLLSQIELLTALTLRHAVPSISQDRDLTVAGGLMSYGGDLAESYRLAGVVFYYLTDRPELATWLERDERNWLQKRLDAERANREKFFRQSWFESMLGPRVLALGIVYFCMITPLYGLSFFPPQSVKDFGLTNVQAGFVTAIPYVIGAIGWSTGDSVPIGTGSANGMW